MPVAAGTAVAVESTYDHVVAVVAVVVVVAVAVVPG